MPKRSTKEDVSQAIARVVLEATHGEFVPRVAPEGKNLAAVYLGRRGGLKGGPARAAALTREERQAIGRIGAAKRWGAKGR